MPSGPIAYAWRGVRRSPGVLVLVVLTLALGIGGATAMFAVVDAMLLNPLPYANGDRLRELSIESGPDSRTPFLKATQIDAIRAQTGTFLAVERFGMGAATLTDGDPEMVATPSLSPGFFQLLGATPLLGRLFTAEEADRQDRVVIISERLWRTRYGSATDIVGRRIGIEGVAHQIVGVLPARFAYPERTAAIWQPLSANPRGQHAVRRGMLVAVLRPGVTPDAAAEVLRAVSASLRRAGSLAAGQTLVTNNTMHQRFAARHRTELSVLLGAVLLVFVIACVNVAHLMLARATAREAEFALMSALGASRVRIIGALLVESAAVAVLGALAGGVLAQALLSTILASVPDYMQMLSATVAGLDWRAFGFAAGLAGATCLIVGLLPVLRVGRLDMIDALKGRAPGIAGDAHERWHRWMMVTQLALVLMLLVTSGLLLRSFARLVSVPPGFEVAGRVVAEIQFPPERYHVGGPATWVIQELERRMEAVPGVRAVTFSVGVPPQSGSLHMDVHPQAEGLLPPRISGLELPELTIAPDYFATLGVPLVAGRTFTAADGDEAVIINTVLARRVWGDASPIGRRFRYDADQPWRTVVGVAGDVKVNGPRDTMGEDMEIYSAWPATMRFAFVSFTIATTSDAAPIARRLRSELKTLDPLLPILDVSTMEQRLSESVARPRFQLRLAWAFAIVASLLAVVGVYGTTTYWVTRRQRELGVRMALGSTPGSLVRLVLGRSLRIAAWAGALGLGAALLLGDVLESMLFETAPNDPLVLVATVGSMAVLVAAACAMPALRASRVDPMRVLRAE
ncbi:MAG: ADOP family duplicated permease [Vicinamibacteraceae bacterium]